jgi:cathepsin X
MKVLSLVLACSSAVSAEEYFNEFKIMEGHTVFEDYVSPLPHEYTNVEALPASFNWGNVNGTNFLTKSLNQHIPQYCGSCWAHGAASAFADRIKIARGGPSGGPDINLAIQYILNCGGEVAGSCHGGSASGTYEFVKRGDNAWPYDTCMQYAACSAESKEGMCGSGDWSCNEINTCRTCSTFSDMGGKCVGLDHFPNASIAEYGSVVGEEKMMAEIYQRGPIACGVDATPLHEYTGGIMSDTTDKGVNHIISVVGWGQDDKTQKSYWIVRNSWGEYWGELSYFRLEKGKNELGIESMCSWATPKDWTEQNFPCYEDGSNCVSSGGSYTDPSKFMAK